MRRTLGEGLSQVDRAYPRRWARAAGEMPRSPPTGGARLQHVKLRRPRGPVPHLPRGGVRSPAGRAGRARGARGGRATADDRRRLGLRRGRRGPAAHRAGQPRRVRPAPDRAPHARGRRASGTRRSSCSADGCPRRCCSPRSACSSWRTGRPTARSRAPRAALGLPMVISSQASVPMEDVAADARRRTALVPALLEQGRRRRRLVRRPRGGGRQRGDRRHARHARARLAHARPRPRRTCRSRAARASPSTRATPPSAGWSRRAPPRPASRASRPRARPRPPSAPCCRWPATTPAGCATTSARRCPARPSRRSSTCSRGSSLTWADLARLRERTSLPIVLKGIQHPGDAALALDHGVDGIIVSNHGGRQVDGAIASLDALPAVVEAVDGRVPVLFDSGDPQRRRRRRRRSRWARRRSCRAAVGLRPGARRGRRCARRDAAPVGRARPDHGAVGVRSVDEIGPRPARPVCPVTRLRSRAERYTGSRARSPAWP